MHLLNDKISKRKFLIRMAKKKIKKGSGSQIPRDKQIQFTQKLPKLDEILKETPYVIVSGMATRMYMPERMTLDVGILVFSDESSYLDKELEDSSCEYVGPLSIGGVTWKLPEGTMLDIIVSQAPWAENAIKTNKIGPDGLPHIDLPFLVIMKLESGRTQDIADISRMLGFADESMLNEVRSLIDKYMPDELEDLESLITLGKLETSQN